MPSSLICCVEDSSFEPEQLQIYAHGEQASRRQDERSDDVFFISVSVGEFLEVVSLPNTSLAGDFSPSVVALASCNDEVDSPPSFESFCIECFPLSGM